jgi:hypothetical protein
MPDSSSRTSLVRLLRRRFMPAKARIILGQAEKFSLHAFMGLEHLADALKDESLRGVKSGEIGGASGILVETDAEHDSGALKMLPSLPKKPACSVTIRN